MNPTLSRIAKVKQRQITQSVNDFIALLPDFLFAFDCCKPREPLAA
jgi:hypothetical protein